jgi:twinkle protein
LKFEAALKKGVDPIDIIRGAEDYAAYVAANITDRSQSRSGDHLVEPRAMGRSAAAARAGTNARRDDLMTTLAELLLEQGIRPRDYRDGDHKLLCPRCSHRRKHRKDPCLSLTIERGRAVWKCHRCEWSGGVRESGGRQDQPRRRAHPVRPKMSLTEPTTGVIRWLADRGISEEVARRNRVGSALVYIPALKAETDCIAFPYFRNGELINIKFRALASKALAQVKDAEAILYGIDDITKTEAIIVEGELDKLSLEMADFNNVISVPNGAHSTARQDKDSASFAYLANCEKYLSCVKRFILAVDADAKGGARGRARSPSRQGTVLASAVARQWRRPMQ